jgi:drug/metabolite transporter (DMT)-like permease
MARAGSDGFVQGALLVATSAIVWSFGGAIARFLSVGDSWTTVFWRSIWAASFLLAFMLVRDGPRGTAKLFASMGVPGFAVAACFATASTSFVVALEHTTVANILLMQAGVPLIAAALAWLAFGERPGLATWLAIGVVVFGVGVMVSQSLTGKVSPIGDGLALTITVVFAIATVIVRRFSHVRMTPAVCLGTIAAGCFAAAMTSGFAVSGRDMGFLFAFGALNLGLGLVCFTTGARMIPAALAALIGLLEPVAGPIWVWLIHGEVPGTFTIAGGAIVFTALVLHVLWQLRMQHAGQIAA